MKKTALATAIAAAMSITGCKSTPWVVTQVDGGDDLGACQISTLSDDVFYDEMLSSAWRRDNYDIEVCLSGPTFASNTVILSWGAWGTGRHALVETKGKGIIYIVI